MQFNVYWIIKFISIVDNVHIVMLQDLLVVVKILKITLWKVQNNFITHLYLEEYIFFCTKEGKESI